MLSSPAIYLGSVGDPSRLNLDLENSSKARTAIFFWMPAESLGCLQPPFFGYKGPLAEIGGGSEIVRLMMDGDRAVWKEGEKRGLVGRKKSWTANGVTASA